MSGAEADSTSARSRWVPADELGVLQLGPVQRGDPEQPGEVERSRQRVELGLGDLQFAYEQVQDVRVDGLLDLQADRRAEAAPHELLLQGLEQVLRVVLLDLQVLVPGDPEHVVREDLHAREQLFEVGRDDVLYGDVTLRGRLQEAGEQRRDLHTGEVPVAADGVAHDDGEVQREPGDVRERVRGVDGERGQHGEDPLPEEGEQTGLFLLGQVGPADQLDALVGQGRGDVLLVAGGVPGHELTGAGPDQVQDLAGLQSRRGPGGDTGRDTALEPGDPDHEELVQVRGEDGEEVSPFE